MSAICSRRHPLVQRLRALARHARGDLLLDGWHLLEEALDAGLVIEAVVVVADGSAAGAPLLARAVARGARVYHAARTVMEALSPVRAPTGVVAVARRPAAPLDAVLQPSPALGLMGLGIQDPGNVGALVRAAAAAGATGILLDANSADPWGWKALRASTGSAFRIPIVRAPDVPALAVTWRTRGIRLCAAVPRAGTPMYRVDFARPTLLLLGSEGAGVPAELAAQADERVSVPMAAGVESLNVAVAAAVLLYEARRQRACA